MSEWRSKSEERAFGPYVRAEIFGDHTVTIEVINSNPIVNGFAFTRQGRDRKHARKIGETLGFVLEEAFRRHDELFNERKTDERTTESGNPSTGKE